MKDSQIKPGRTYTLKGLRAGSQVLPTFIAKCTGKEAGLYIFAALGGVPVYAKAKNVHPADQPVPQAVPEPSVLPSSVTELQAMVKRLELVTDPVEYDRLVGEIGEKTKALREERKKPARKPVVRPRVVAPVKKPTRGQRRGVVKVVENSPPVQPNGAPFKVAGGRRTIRNEEGGTLELER